MRGAAEVPWFVQPEAQQAEGRPHGSLQLLVAAYGFLTELISSLW